MHRLIAAALATLIVIEFSQTCFAEDALTGHTWRTTPVSIKTLYISGFWSGFLVGRSEGIVKGIATTYYGILKFVCTNEKDTACSNFKKVTPEDAWKYATDSIRQKETFESTNYYVKEVDSFYEAFPLCRGQML